MKELGNGNLIFSDVTLKALPALEAITVDDFFEEFDQVYYAKPQLVLTEQQKLLSHSCGERPSKVFAAFGVLRI